MPNRQVHRSVDLNVTPLIDVLLVLLVIFMAELPTRLWEIFQSRTDKTVYILGDAALRYGAIVDIMDPAKGAGVSRVGVITDGMRRNAGVGAM